MHTSKSFEEIFELYKGNNFCVFDTETDLIDKNKSVMAFPPEFVVGIFYGGRTNLFTTINKPGTFTSIISSYPIVVGHNLPFDLRVMGIEIDKDTVYWDTAIVEYEITGQYHTYPTLQSLADKYIPGRTKEEVVSEMIKSGVSPKDIPAELLEKYCEEDVSLTRDIFCKQIEYIASHFSKKQVNLLLQRLKFRAVTYTMSVEGLALDANMLDGAINSMKDELENLEIWLKGTMYMHLIHMKYEDINVNSLDQIRTVIFGGTYKVVRDEPTGEYYKTGAKAGQPKTKKVTETVVHTSANSLNAGFIYSPKSGNKVDEAVLLNVRNVLDRSCRAKSCVEFIDKLLEYRNINKNLSTYFEGYRNVGNRIGDTVYVHTEYKHTGTPTGRISSTKPNVQNLKSG